MVFEEVQRIIAERLGLDLVDITMDSSLDEDLKADSLDILDIAASIEDQFDIRIPQEDLQEMEKVSDLVSYIEGF